MSGWRNWRADGARVVDAGGLVAVCDSVDIARAVAAIPHAVGALDQLLRLVGAWSEQHEVQLEAVPEIAAARVALAGLRGRILPAASPAAAALGEEDRRRLIEERDDARAEAAALRAQLADTLPPAALVELALRLDDADLEAATKAYRSVERGKGAEKRAIEAAAAALVERLRARVGASAPGAVPDPQVAP